MFPDDLRVEEEWIEEWVMVDLASDCAARETCILFSEARLEIVLDLVTDRLSPDLPSDSAGRNPASIEF